MRRVVQHSVLSLLGVIGLGAASLAAPGGLYSSAPPTPTYESDAPPSRETEHGVSTDGEASYSIPFDVPPGRAGTQPHVSLEYSSRAGLRGGIAMGWTLPIPMISVDTSEGRVREVKYQAGGRRLIPVDEPQAHPNVVAYRADGDTSYTRYEKVSTTGEHSYWVARSTDGTTFMYGAGANSRDVRTDGSPGDGVYGGEGRWFLSSTRDPRGNTINYHYETVYGSAKNGSITNTPVDVVLTGISYGGNTGDRDAEAHAFVEFVWQSSLTTCPGSSVPIGAQFTYRTGIRRYEGAKKLLAIRAYVKSGLGGSWLKRRELTLGYSAAAESCSGMHAPLRQLTSVQQKAWGPDDPVSTPSVSLPPITFEYGPLEYLHASQSNAWTDAISTGKNPLNNDKPGGWPTLDSALMDLDGDGAPENVSGSSCESFPTMPWANGVSAKDDGPPFYKAGWEGCSLAAQVTHRETPRDQTIPGNVIDWSCGRPANFYGYRFMDVNGDGKSDLVAALDYQKGRYRPTEDPAVAGDYPACSTLPAPPCRNSANEPIACLFAPAHQRVMPMDNSFGPNGNGVYMNAAGASGSGGSGGGTGGSGGSGGSTSCPNDTCARNGGCYGTESSCCSADFCSNDEGPIMDPPTPDPLDDVYQGHPGGAIYEVNGAPPPPPNGKCGHVPDLHCGYYVYRVHLNQSVGGGQPVFSPSPTLVRSPVPLDNMEMSTDFGSGPTANASAWRALTDIDGDSRPDALYQRPLYMLGVYDSAPEPFQVWFGSRSGTGSFTGRADGSGRPWHTPPGADGLRSHIDANVEETLIRGSRYFRASNEIVSLHDVNGDGLADLVRREPGANGTFLIRAFFNTGAGFETGAGTVLSTSLPAMSRRLRWFAAVRTAAQEEIELSIMGVRPADLDGDGLSDVIQLPEPNNDNATHINPMATIPGNTIAHFSVGDRLVPVNANARFGPFRKAFAQITIAENHAFRTVSDFSDLDGDGQPDMLMPQDSAWCTPQAGSYITYQNCALYAQGFLAAKTPRHLLTKVHNGLGASVEFSYTTMRDPAVVSRDANHQRTNSEWVVKSMKVSGNGLHAITDYAYENPVSNFDRYGRFGFRGFQKVSETGPASSTGHRRRSVISFRYDLEETGLEQRRLIGELQPNAAERLLEVVETEYVATPLFEGAVRVFQVSNTIRSTCEAPVDGPIEASTGGCLANASIHRVASEWTAFGPDAPPNSGGGGNGGTGASGGIGGFGGFGLGGFGNVGNFGGFGSILGKGGTGGLAGKGGSGGLAGKGGTGGFGGFGSIGGKAGTGGTSGKGGTSGFGGFGSIGGKAGTGGSGGSGGTGGGGGEEPPGIIPVLYEITKSRRLPTRNDSTLDVRVETHAYELRYGSNEFQLLRTERRVRDSSNATYERLTTKYDAAGNPIESAQWIDNAKAAVTTRVYDAYGNVTQVLRPNQQGVSTPLPQYIEYDEFHLYQRTFENELGQVTEKKFDLGTGALLQTRGFSSPAGTPIERNTIDGLGRVTMRERGVDDGVSTNVNTVYRAQYLDTGANRSVHTEALLDGNQLVSVVVSFDAFGRIIREETPTEAGPRVVTRAYDAAGNLSSVELPSPSGSGTQLFTMDYDALGRTIKSSSPLEAPVVTSYHGTTTIVRRTASDGSPSTEKIVSQDAFGRVVSVTEGKTDPATTLYAYDVADRVVTIMDADGVVTELGYDLRGLRTRITRAGTELSYGYDRNGNRVALAHPTGTEPLDPTADVSVWRYDALDRLIESEPALRKWTTSEVERYGSGPGASHKTSYKYDDPGTGFGIGRLSAVSTPAMTVQYAYTPEGWVEKETRAFQIAPEGTTWSDSATQAVLHGPNGHALDVAYPDGKVSATFKYDQRGMPAGIELHGAGWSTPAVEFKRNLAGLVVERQSGSGGLQKYTYDDEGRTLTNVITAGSLVAGEAFGYTSLGNVSFSKDMFSARTIEYSYDERDQLIGAESGGTYDAKLAYSGAGRVLQAQVKIANDDQLSRSVIHDYAPHDANDTADPAAVRSLKSVLDDSEVAALFYDPSGNLVRKVTDQGSFSLVYDGENRLREIENEANGDFEIYYYDHTGERVLTYKRVASDVSVRHRFGSTELLHDASGKRSTVDVMAGDQPIARVSDGKAQSIEYLWNGALGSLLAVTDAAQNAVAQFGYGAFGELLYADGPNAAVFDRRYNGKPVDEISGLRYYGARYYDPLTLSWTSADPYYRFTPEMQLGDPRRASLYTFCLNNPVRFVDPDGRDIDTKADKKGEIVIYSGDLVKGKVSENVTVEAGTVELKTDGQYLSLEAKGAAIEGMWGSDELQGGFELTVFEAGGGAGIKNGSAHVKAGVTVVEAKAKGKYGEDGASVTVGVGVAVAAEFEGSVGNGKLAFKAKLGLVIEVEVDAKKYTDALLAPIQLPTGPQQSMPNVDLDSEEQTSMHATGVAQVEAPPPPPKPKPKRKRERERQRPECGGYTAGGGFVMGRGR